MTGPTGPTGNMTRDVVFCLLGNLAVGNDQTNHIPMPYAGTMVALRAVVTTAPTGSALSFRVNLTHNGVKTAIQNSGDQVGIAATATAGTSTTFAVTSFVAGDYFSVDVTAVGSSTPGTTATVVLTVRYS